MNGNLEILNRTTIFQGLFYEPKKDGSSLFQFFGLSHIQILNEFNPLSKLVIEELSYFDPLENSGFDYSLVTNTKTINDYIELVSKFVIADTFYFVDIGITIENNIYLDAHDDNGIYLLFPKKVSSKEILKRIFERFNIDSSLSEEIIKKQNRFYYRFSTNGTIEGKFKNYENFYNSL